MPTIDLASGVNKAVQWAGDVPWGLAYIGGGILVVRLLAEFGPAFSGLTEGEAVTVFAAVAGISGAVAQWLASQQFKKLSRQVNVIELLPAILAIIAATAILTVAMLPPSPLGTAFHDFLGQAGLV